MNDGTTPAASERSRAGLTIAVIALSVVAHLWRLGERPLAHDEAIDAFFSWQARHGGVIRYDPVYHGPLRFYLEGVVLNTFGTTPGWARLVAALAGIAATLVIALSVRTLGRLGAPVAALLFTVSPTVLTVTRTGREDSLVALVSVGLLVIVARMLVEPRAGYVLGGAALLAVSFGLKETTFIFGFAAACFLVGLAIAGWRRRQGESARVLGRVAALGPAPWMWGGAIFIVTFMAIFTCFFRYGAGFESGLLDGLRYWWSQHEVGRGSQRWFFYATVYAAYEWLVLGLAAVGFITGLRRRSVVDAWFATMAGVQFAVYTWAGEKFAWLAVHPLIPAVLLAGRGAQAVAGRYAEPRRRLVLAGFTIAVVGTALVALRPAITHGDDPRELLVTVQTSTEVPEIVDALAAGQRDGSIRSIFVDDRDSGAWPWAWYLHGFEGVLFAPIDPTAELPDGYDAYIVSAITAPPPTPDGYTMRRFPLRRWWLPDYGNASPADLIDWFLTRDTWNDTGSSDQYLILRSTGG